MRFLEESGSLSGERTSIPHLIVLILLLTFAGLLVGQALPFDYFSPYGMVGRNNGKYLIEALKTFHDSTGAYPDSLEQLLPKYLKRYGSLHPTKEERAPDHKYRRVDDDFELSFRFPGLGISRCSYWASAQEWNCRVGY